MKSALPAQREARRPVTRKSRTDAVAATEAVSVPDFSAAVVSGRGGARGGQSLKAVGGAFRPRDQPCEGRYHCPVAFRSDGRDDVHAGAEVDRIQGSGQRHVPSHCSGRKILSTPAFWAAPGVPASPEQRGHAGVDWKDCDHAARASGGLLLSRNSQPERPPRGVPGSAIVRNALWSRVGVPAPWRTRHIPMERDFRVPLTHPVFVPSNDRGMGAGHPSHRVPTGRTAALPAVFNCDVLVTPSRLGVFVLATGDGSVLPHRLPRRLDEPEGPVAVVVPGHGAVEVLG